jgi:predicted RNA binding protein YcfA (HicA-like mRNA interferase family)
MTPRLRVLSGRDVARALGRFGFEVVATRGSHAKLRRTTRAGTDTITVPLHKELAPGTTRAMYRQAARFVPEDDLRPWFFA